MSYDITHICHIDATSKAVFEALSTLEGLSRWWTSETEGNPELGRTLVFKFGGKFRNEMEVTRFESDQLVEWTVLDAAADWIGTKIRFQLDKNEGKTRIRFSHSGFKNQDDFFAQCSFSWAKYLISLRNLVENGQGQPYSKSKPFD